MDQGNIAGLLGRFFVEVLMISFPVLMIALVIGLVVAIFQTVTSIQEQTLSFVPKLLAIFAVLFFLGGWMLKRLMEYTIYLINLMGQ
jgi:flagellar biosynthetic protein FliQ